MPFEFKEQFVGTTGFVCWAEIHYFPQQSTGEDALCWGLRQACGRACGRAKPLQCCPLQCMGWLSICSLSTPLGKYDGVNAGVPASHVPVIPPSAPPCFAFYVPGIFLDSMQNKMDSICIW